MTIRLTEAELEEQFQEADEEELLFDPTDKLDTESEKKWGSAIFH